ncbi:MAG: F0F1 ATP synthase subunit alpha [Lachnospiraceae bacterium]|nr:F0F1 ATP synthase subunit alpha [Lachnospiraceae bacterium]
MSDIKGGNAVLYSAKRPSDDQLARIKKFVDARYEGISDILWEQDDKCFPGFKLKIGDDVFDWTREGRLAQFRDELQAVADRADESDNVISMYREAVEKWHARPAAEEEGVAVMVGDGIVIVDGLPGVVYGEIVVFETGVKGMVQDLTPDSVGVILFGDESEVTEGSRVRRTHKMAGMPVSDGFIGRVINALGEPVDDAGPIFADEYRMIETPAPGIIERAPVDTPMNTGLLCIDSMFPIGRGQRELIIGDRQTGKTTVAIDTILNQKGNGVICIYVAIGQKAGSVAQLAHTLREAGAMDYTIIVNASASETASIQYIAPYAACSLGEYFMYKGKDVLIVYDDLSKHAVAYRALSLLLERSPGREAYPGDVFYLHSRLLERSARLSDELGGGSITALPIVETQAGDVAAYIPTNIISITDGQIFLESDLFYSGQRPAVNVGLSVSRVGGAAQTKAMKKATGSLRLDLSQYREMEVFTQFSSDLDGLTKKRLVYGQGLMRVLRQEQGKPFKEHEQVIILICATAHIMQDVPLGEIAAFRRKLLDFFETEHADICSKIDSEHVITDDDKKFIVDCAKDFAGIAE